MTLAANIERVLAHTRKERDELLSKAARAAGDSLESRVETETILRQYEALDERTKKLERRAAGLAVKVTAEPPTYSRNSPHSYFRDLTAARIGRGTNESTERLQRNEREVLEWEAREGELRQRREARKLAELGIEVGFEKRAASTASGSGDAFTPPLWLVKEFATIDRPGRPLANRIGSLLCPLGIKSVNVPKLTAGTTAGSVAENATATQTSITDSALTSPVTLIAGQEDVSLQFFDQIPAPGCDPIILEDLLAAYDSALSTFLYTGSGSGDIFAGLGTISGTTAVTYTSGSPAGGAFFTALAQTVAQVADAREKMPTSIFMRGARWAWLGAQQDSEGRPFMPPSNHAQLPQLPPNEDPTSLDTILEPRLQQTPPVGTVLGIPVWADGSIPANLGSGTNQDLVYVLREQDLLLWESTPRFSVAMDYSGSSTLTAKLTLRAYAAAILNRHPTGVGQLGGTGLVVQSGY